MPIVEEDIDGLSGLLFPFYDADTHMLYLAGKVSAAYLWVTTRKLFLRTVHFLRLTSFRTKLMSIKLSKLYYRFLF